MLHVLRDCWGVIPQAVVGHSSGEIAAACAAGYLDEANAIKAAFYRGQASMKVEMSDVGMLAVGLGPEAVAPYMATYEGLVHVACYNSPDSVTLSGKNEALEGVKAALVKDHHFARSLQVNLAYHSTFMHEIGEVYEGMLEENFVPVAAQEGKNATWFSSVSGVERQTTEEADKAYWKANMVSPVRFDSAVQNMISGKTGCNFLIELGPSGALAGPIGQIKNSMPEGSANVEYSTALTRGQEAIDALFGVAGKLFVAGTAIDLAKVNKPAEGLLPPAVISDLPNYSWNHGTKYWYESDASHDWRYREFPHHDLIGSKVLGTTWDSPSWRKALAVEDLPWLKDHKMGSDIVFPAAGFLAMAIEGVRQITQVQADREGIALSLNTRYRVRNSTFPRALVLEEGKKANIMLAMVKSPGSNNPWYEFRVRSKTADVWNEHCKGSVRIEEIVSKSASSEDLAPLQHPTSGDIWYKALGEVGYGFGPAFQKNLKIESTSNQRTSRSTVNLSDPESAYPQSPYPMHPASIDGCLQTCSPALWNGNRSSINAVLIPAIIDDLVVCPRPRDNVAEGLSLASSQYVGLGRKELTKNYLTNATVYDPESGAMLFRVKGLRFHQLDMDTDEGSGHKYTQLQWGPDVGFLTQDGLKSWLSAENKIGTQAINQVLDILAHKKPALNIAEICLVPGESESVWLGGESGIRQCCQQIVFASPDAKALVAAQEQHKGSSAAKFHLFDVSQPIPDGNPLDLVILRVVSMSPS